MASFSMMTEEALGVPMDDRPFKSRADVSLTTDAAKLRAWSLSADRFSKVCARDKRNLLNGVFRC